MDYKAIFFDRDGTLTYGNKEKIKWYKETIEEWSKRKLQLDYDRMMKLFEIAGYPKDGLKSLNVKAHESIYVDDYDIEADGARKIGFTAFHLDRSGKKKSEWVINSLKEIINYVEGIKY